MSIKFTKSEVETIIKEEVSKLINEQGGRRTFGAKLKGDICLELLRDEDGVDFVQNNFASLKRLLMPVVARAKKQAGPKAVGFAWLGDNLFLKQEVWLRTLGRVTRKGLITDPNRTSAGVDGFYEDIIGMMQDYIETLDDDGVKKNPPIDGDRLDPYDGFASPGFGVRTMTVRGRVQPRAGMDADQAFARQYVWGPGQFADEVITIFLNWFCSGGKFGSAPAPAPAPKPKPEEAPGGDEFVGPPAPTPGTGGGGPVSECPQFHRALKSATSGPLKQAISDLQLVLVNLGFSVAKKGASTPFGPGKPGAIEGSSSERRKYQIDGKCGPKTIDAVERFQKDAVKLGIDLGKSGPNKDGVDGMPGPLTMKALQKYEELLAAIASPKAGAFTPKQNSSGVVVTGPDGQAMQFNPEGGLKKMQENKDPATLKEHFTKWNKLWD